MARALPNTGQSPGAADTFSGSGNVTSLGKSDTHPITCLRPMLSWHQIFSHFPSFVVIFWLRSPPAVSHKKTAVVLINANPVTGAQQVRDTHEMNGGSYETG